ncbi:MAG: redoxin family protein [Eggerthellaceae bacterium]|nr:redoxin family protein [Eggerthellaceae bacterium]
MRKMTLRMLAAATTLALSWGLAGCGGNPEETPEAAPEDPAPASAEQRYADGDVMPEYLMGAYVLKVGDAAPDFTVELVDANGLTGETLSLADLRGKVVVVDFWAPWCPYCVRDLPVWDELAGETGDDLVILAVDSGGDTFGEMKGFIAETGYRVTWALVNESMARAYPCPGIPYDVIVDRDGNIAFIAEGSYGNRMAAVMRGVLKDLT